MVGWNKMKNLIVSAEDATRDLSEVNIVPEESVCDMGSPGWTKGPVLTPCRTPMGEYVVPEGGKPLTSLGDSCPGPADYLPKSEPTKMAAPHFSIVGKPKLVNSKKALPGPSEYNTSGDIKWKNKTFSLKGRGKSYFDEQAEKSITLLGKYKVEHKSFGHEGPKFKMGMKASSEIYTGPGNSLVQPVDTKGFQTPGPNYRPNSGYWGRGSKKSFGIPCKRPPKKGPGPSDYHADDTSRGPAHSFGMKLPEPVAVQQTVNKFSPAANTYNLGTTIGKAPAVSISGRPAERQISDAVPCPSTYCPDQRTYNNYKATTLAYRWFDPEEKKQPGPADHHVQHVNLQRSPRYTCRQQVKPSYPDTQIYNHKADNSPGPGAYNITTHFVNNDSPAYSFRKRLEPTVDRERFPGPNVYIREKKDKPDTRKAPAFSMATRLEYPDSRKKYPGPGEYRPKVLETDRGKYTMTSRPQGKKRHSNPGPNVYALPELISGKSKGVVFKSRASPYIYSGYRSRKLEEPTQLPMIKH